MKITLYSTDPKTSKKSVTLTILWICVLVASFKLLVSGMSIYGHIFSDFTGVDFAAVVGAAGALYWGRKKETHKSDIDFINNMREGE